MGLEGAIQKNWASKGGGSQKNMVCKGGVTKNNYTFKCCKQASVRVKKPCQNAQNDISCGSENSNFSGEHSPGPPLLCYVPNASNSTQQLIAYKRRKPILTDGIHNKQLRQCQLLGACDFCTLIQSLVTKRLTKLDIF